MAGFQFDRLQFLTAVAVTLSNEDRGIVKYPVQSAEQIRITGEVFGLGVRLPVAGENHAARTLFVVTSFDQIIKEMLDVCLIEGATTYLVNNQAGGLLWELIAAPHRFILRTSRRRWFSSEAFTGIPLFIRSIC